MPKIIKITVENKLIMEKRHLNVYHHSTGRAHIISHNCTIILPLRKVSEDDYLHISVVRGPGCLKNGCLLHVPSWVDVVIFAEGKVR
jgi:hypothetical protein